LHPNTFNFIRSFDPMIIIVFGGLGSVSGTLVASFAWALVLEGFLRLWLPEGFETWRLVVYPLLLILLMLLRPKGLFGDFEFPFLRQLIPPLSPTAQARKQERLVTPLLKKCQMSSDRAITLRPRRLENERPVYGSNIDPGASNRRQWPHAPVIGNTVVQTVWRAAGLQ
jgi:hypothetical protein